MLRQQLSAEGAESLGESPCGGSGSYPFFFSVFFFTTMKNCI